MTILTETERVTTLVYYERGWSYQEIVAELLERRTEKLKQDMQREVMFIITHRFSDVESSALQDILQKRLARGDIEVDGRIIKVPPSKRVHHDYGYPDKKLSGGT